MSARQGRVTRLAIAALCASASTAFPERLPVSTLTSTDGLVHDRVKCVVSDPTGYLWFCTPLGLSRFDGQRFVSYRVPQGMPIDSVNDLLIDRSGTYWVATNGGGVCRFDPRVPGDRALDSQARAEPARSACTVHPVGKSRPSGRVNALLEDRRGFIWAATDDGVFVLDRRGPAAQFEPVATGLPGTRDRLMQVWRVAEQESGRLWMASTWGLVVRETDGRFRQLRVHPRNLPGAQSVAIDATGRIWVGLPDGVAVFHPQPADAGGSWTVRPARAGSDVEGRVDLPAAPGDAVFLDTRTLGNVDVRAIHVEKTGVFLGGALGVTEFDGQRARTYGNAEGLTGTLVRAIGRDRDGNLWIGSEAGGVVKVARHGFLGFDERDGLADPRVLSVTEGPSGHLFVVTPGPVIHRLDGRRFASVKLAGGPTVPAGTPSQVALLDRHGAWWIASDQGLLHFAAVGPLERLALVRPRRYGVADGLASDRTFRPFEDAAGNIWVGTAGATSVARLDRRTGRVEQHLPVAGAQPSNPATAFAEDTTGTLWIGFREGGLARWRQSGFETFGVADGVPEGQITGLHVDRRGRLWIASERTLVRADDPAAARPTFRVYPAVPFSRCIVEDARGNLYVGTSVGVFRIDSATERVTQFTTSEGLGHSEVLVAYADRQQRLWFGSVRGLSQMVSPVERVDGERPTFISGIRVAGVPMALSGVGEREVRGLTLPPYETNVEIEFHTLRFSGGPTQTFEYRLARDSEWVPVGTQRTVTFARLSPGVYDFEVRAVGPGGPIGTPATVSFRILPPIWRRWWVLVLAGAMVAIVVYGGYRYRLRRLLEIERVRTAIATDLHDDIGASLTQVAVLSEVALRSVTTDVPAAREQLDRIASVSRDLVSAMSDVVWAVNPQRDSLSDLVHRMRRFASDTFTGRGLEFSFVAPSDDAPRRLRADVRRHVYLVFKECVNNAVRHSGCSRVEICFTIDRKHLALTVRDNGRGLGASAAASGHGLQNMARRAAAMRGTFDVGIAPDGGSVARLDLPVH